MCGAFRAPAALQGGLPRAHPSPPSARWECGSLPSKPGAPGGPRGPSRPGAPGKPCCPGAPGSPGWPENPWHALASCGRGDETVKPAPRGSLQGTAAPQRCPVTTGFAGGKESGKHTEAQRQGGRSSRSPPEPVTTILLDFFLALVPVTRHAGGICGTDISLQARFSSSFSHLMLRFEHLATF